MLFDLQKAGVHVEIVNRPFTSQTQNGPREFGAGTLMIPMGFQSLSESNVTDELKTLSVVNHQQVYATSTGFNLEGIDLGSNLVGAVTQPKVIMVVGDGVSSYEAGEIWYLLDSELGMPITKVNSDQMGRVNLFDYNTLILPSGNYNSFSESVVNHLKDWINRGGTVISMKTASLWLNQKEIIKESMVARGESTDPKELPFAERSAFEGAKQVGGSIYMARLDLTHPITYGYNRETLPVYRNNSIFVQPSKDKYLTPVRYTENPLLGGYISDKNLELLKQSASLIISPVGRGRVINFFDSPNFRGTWFGTNKLFLNAIFFGDKMD
ncbi:hypothetical protein V8V91_27050 [Algoriphagus halophilus]|uniref:hypothetical protein n=1 Tax=Algoriphagus halophilus TaxID=226505 RepID=UPI003590262F